MVLACISPPAMGVSALARRAAPASRARMPGSLSSRRWPTAPPWRRAPTTSDVPICTLSSLGSRRVREEFKRPSRQGSQPTSRTGPRTCGRACTGRTRAAAHAPPRRPPRARSRSAPPEQRALRCGLSGRRPAGREEGRAQPPRSQGRDGRGWDSERRSRSESPSDQVRTTRREGATAFERRAGEQKDAPPCASF